MHAEEGNVRKELKWSRHEVFESEGSIYISMSEVKNYSSTPR